MRMFQRQSKSKIHNVKTEPEQFARAQPVMEAISKSAVIMVGVCYGFGLIVVNVYLSKFGFYSLGLFRVSYILAGVWAFSTLAFVWTFWVSLNYAISLPSPNRIRQVLFVTLVVVLYWSACQWVFSVLKIQSEPYTWANLPVFLSASVLLGLGSVVFKDILKKLGIIEHARQRDIVDRNIEYVVFVVLSFVYMFVFARELYPFVPSEIGGGVTRKVIIIPKPELKDILSLSGIIVRETEDLDSTPKYFTEPLPLLLETDGQYIVLAGKKDSSYAVSIRADLIEVIIHTDRKTDAMITAPFKLDSSKGVTR